MKLLASPASPYTRKVRIVLAEKKIECELEIVDVAPAENPVNAHNPLGKIPTLVLDDGTALYDSRVIVEFLDSASPISRLIPEDMRDRVAVRRWEALADGVLDAGLLVRYESLRRQERAEQGLDRQAARAHAARHGAASRPSSTSAPGATASATRSPTSRSAAAWAGSTSASPAASTGAPSIPASRGTTRS